MTYTPTTWVEDVTKLGPTNLNHLEQGVTAVAKAVVTPEQYGAIGNGVTDDTAAVQACFDAADTARGSVVLSGTYLVGTINYRNQSIQGVGTLLGKPSQDVLHGDSSLAYTSRQTFAEIGVGVTIIVDDSVDAHASFTHRGGVGNAGLAYDYANGATTTPLGLYRISVKATFQSLSNTSGGKNASCGLYCQSGGSAFRVESNFLRLVYGFWTDMPTSNPTSVDLGFDHIVGSMFLNACSNSVRFVNFTAGKLDRLISQGSSVNGIQLTGVQMTARNGCSSLSFDTVYIEHCTSAPLSMDATTNLVTFENLWVSGPQASLVVAGSHVRIGTLFLSNNNGVAGVPQLTISGNSNTIENLTIESGGTVADGWDLVTNTGKGNKVVGATFYDGSNPTNLVPLSLIRDSRCRHVRDAMPLLLGRMSPLPVSGDDWLIQPHAIKPTGLTEGNQFSYVADTAADLGFSLHLTSGNTDAGLAALNGINGTQIGVFLPPCPVRVYVCAKTDASGGTQAWSLESPNSTSVGSATLAFGTSYVVRSFDADLTGKAVGTAIRFELNAVGGSATTIDIAWIAFRPFMAEALVGGAVLQQIAAPTYGTTVTLDVSAGRRQTITVTDTTAFTVAAPTNPPSSTQTAELTIEVVNSSGGSMGAITWNSAFVFAGLTWTNPASTKKRFARFEWNGTKWLCVAVAAADY